MAETLRSLDYSVLQQCMHCGMCLPTCPTYDATKRERNSPRGRISLMRAVADKQLEISQEFANEMSYCLGCLACQTACPAGVNYAELFETARNDIERERVVAGFGRTLTRTLTLGGLFLHPRALRLAGATLRIYQRTGLQTLVRRVGAVRLLPPALRRLEPQTPPVAAAFSNRLIPFRLEPGGRRRFRVGLLTGCVQDLVFPDVNRDTADVLLANGCAVDTPAVQPCCGSLHAHNGEREMARLLARRLIDLMPPADYDAIISNAGGCGSHLRHYGPLLSDDPQYADAARLWDTKLRDVHEWLVEIGYRDPNAGPFDAHTSVTYHDSCHLAHDQKIVSQPRELLRRLANVALVDLDESSWCCGAAGVYSITQPAQADALLNRKVDRIRTTAATVLATANPGCMLQIARGIDARGLRVRVVHPISLLASAYRREQARPGATTPPTHDVQTASPTEHEVHAP